MLPSREDTLMVVQQAPITRGPVKWHHPPPIIILPRVGEGSGTASNPPCELNKCQWDSFFRTLLLSGLGIPELFGDSGGSSCCCWMARWPVCVWWDDVIIEELRSRLSI